MLKIVSEICDNPSAFPGLDRQLYDFVSALDTKAILGAGLYIRVNDNAATSVSNVVQHENCPFVTDRLIGRKLTDEDSIAVHCLINGGPVQGTSFMTPQHRCFHIPNKNGDALIQIATPNNNDSVPTHFMDKIHKDTRIMYIANNLLQDAATLRNNIGIDHSQLWPAYAPRDVVLYGDITGHSKVTQQIGHAGFRSLFKCFMNNHLVPLCRDYNACSFRAPQGDNYWLGLTQNDTSEPVTNIINRRAIPLARELNKGLEEVVRYYCHDPSNIYLKQTIGAGEHNAFASPEHLDVYMIHSSELYARLAKLAKELPRNRNILATGSNEGVAFIDPSHLRTGAPAKSRTGYCEIKLT